MRTKAMSMLVLAVALPAATPQAAQIKRGAYLVDIMGCEHCHTPHEMGPEGLVPIQSLRLSGHPAAMKLPPAPDLGPGPWVWSAVGSNTAFAGPWGVSYAANLTPDRETGLGSLSEQDWLALCRNGRHLGKGRPLLPPMPVQSLAAASVADLKAIWAYLRNLPPIRNAVPDPVDPPAHP
jgi:hypothetical protein